MKTLSMAPYPAVILLTDDRKEFYRVYKRMTGYAYNGGHAQGTMCRMEKPDSDKKYVFLVHAKGTPTLAHEFSHAILDVFDIAGIDPISANGEPFAYMMSHLMETALKKKARSRRAPSASDVVTVQA